MGVIAIVVVAWCCLSALFVLLVNLADRLRRRSSRSGQVEHHLVILADPPSGTGRRQRPSCDRIPESVPPAGRTD